MKFDTLPAWLTWLESLHPEVMDLGLGRVGQVAKHLALTQTTGRVITIAGTNGKGTCVAALESLLCAQNYRVGSFTSPHILRYNERIRINREPMSDADICEAFAAIDKGRGDTTLTYFEFSTLAALWLFRREAVDFLLLEVGLGGRLDSVNIIDADIAVITSIDLDHQHWLGNTRESVAAEKAGIFRRGQQVVCAEPDPPQSLLQSAADKQCTMLRVDREFSWRCQETDTADNLWDMRVSQPHKDPAEYCVKALSLPELPLPSLAAALQVCALVKPLPSDKTIASAYRDIRIAGRFHRVNYGGQPLIFDVAHNPAATRYLAKLLHKIEQRVLVVIAMMGDKDLAGSLEPLVPFVDQWYIGGLIDTPRAASPQQVADTLAALGVDIAHYSLNDTVIEAFEMAMQALKDSKAPQQPILVCGSFYTIADIMDYCKLPV